MFSANILNFVSDLQDVAVKDFVQVTYTDAVNILLKADKKFEFPVCSSSRYIMYMY